MQDTPATTLARFLTGARFADLPDWAVDKAKDHALDTLGAMLAGLEAKETVLARRVLGAGVPSVRDIALLRGIAAHAHELDDSGGCDHSGAVVWPAILAALTLSDRPVHGREALLAMVLGYDVGRRVLMGFGGYVPHNDAGWHSTGTCGVFAAAAAAGRILRLDAARMAAALGLAGSFAAGTWAFIHDGAMNKRIHAGRAAESGLLAAMMARSGVSGASHVFSPGWGGFFDTYGGPANTPGALLDGLGRDWLIRDAAIKPHACCRDVHAAIDAVARIMARDGIGAREVARVQARLSPFLIGMVGGRDVSTMPAAQMSLPYGIAAQLLYGAAGLDDYDDARRRAPEVADLMRKIEIVEDAGVTASWASSVAVTLRDGRRIEEATTHALGTPDNPMSRAAVRAKFDALAGRVLPADRVCALAARIGALQDCDDARALVADVTP